LIRDKWRGSPRAVYCKRYGGGARGNGPRRGTAGRQGAPMALLMLHDKRKFNYVILALLGLLVASMVLSYLGVF
jgi:hypothetical protein